MIELKNDDGASGCRFLAHLILTVVSDSTGLTVADRSFEPARVSPDECADKCYQSFDQHLLAWACC